MENRLMPYAATTSFGMQRILVLAPHPDDEVFGCGGALLQQVDHGGAAQVIVMTDGDYLPSPTDTREYAQTRRAESRRAAQVLGYGEPVFWGLKDRGLEYGEQLVQRILDQIQTFEPDGVFAPSVYEMHPDHRALGMATLEAVRRCGASCKLVMYEVGIPMPRPNVLLDISTWAERKQYAMACFASQLQGQAYDTQIRALNCFRTYTLGMQVTAAEAYRVVDPSELARGTLELYESEYQRQRNMGLPMLPEDVPLVSVIVWGQGAELPARTLDSVALQTYPHTEVLLLQSDATDAPPLPAACGRFPLVPVRTASTTSRTAVINAAMLSAKGQYLIILDAENQLLPDHLQKLVTSLKSSRAMAICTGVRFVNDLGEVVSVLDEPWDDEQLKASSYYPPNAILFARSLVEQGCRFRETPGPLDYRDFWLQISALTVFAHVPLVSAVCKRTDQNRGHLTELQRLQAVLRDSLEQVTKNSAQLAEQTARVQELEAHLAKQHAQMEHLTAALATQSAHALALQTTVGALRASTSWRVTKPLRALSRLLRGQR